jgi:hypothetical protein
MSLVNVKGLCNKLIFTAVIVLNTLSGTEKNSLNRRCRYFNCFNFDIFDGIKLNLFPVRLRCINDCNLSKSLGTVYK